MFRNERYRGWVIYSNKRRSKDILRYHWKNYTKTLEIEPKLKSSSTSNCEFVKACLQRILSPNASEFLALVLGILNWNLVARILDRDASIILTLFRIVPSANHIPISTHQKSPLVSSKEAVLLGNAMPMRQTCLHWYFKWSFLYILWFVSNTFILKSDCHHNTLT